MTRGHWIGVMSVMGITCGHGADAAFPLQKAVVTVEEPTGHRRRAELVQNGFPLAPGQLREGESLTVVDASGRPVPTQTLPLVRHRDGSVKWLLLQFPVSVGARQRATFHVKQGVPLKPKPAVWVRQQEDAIEVDTGRLRFEVQRQAGILLGRVWLAGRLVVDAQETLRLEVLEADGSTHTTVAQPADVFEVEEAGPLVAVLHLGGWLRGDRGQKWYRCESRITAYAGSASLLADHSLIPLDGPKTHAIRRLSLRCRPVLGKDARYMVALDGQAPVVPGRHSGLLAQGSPVRLFQRAPQLENPVEVRQGKPAKVRDWLFRVTEGQDHREVAVGKSAPGWFSLTGDSFGLGMAVRDFAPQANKAIELGTDGQVAVDLWADDDGETVNLTVGRSKSHEVLYEFFRPEGQAAAGESLAGFDRNLIATVDPEYLCSTGVMWGLSPAATSPFPKFEQDMETCFDACLANREKTPGEWGFLHLGDEVWMGGYGAKGVMYAGQEYDPGHAAFVFYARTGKRKYYDVGCQWARHYMDIEVDPRDGTPRFHGYGDQGNTHEDFNTGLEWGHVICDQMCDYYCFTGNRRAYEIIGKLRDKTLPVGSNPRAISQQCERALGWPLLSLMHLYEVTGDERCLDAGRKVVEYIKQYAADPAKEMETGTWWRCWMMDGSKPFMNATVHDGLNRYHLLTGDDSIIPAVRTGLDWMLANCWDAETGSFIVEYNPCGGRTLSFWTNYDFTLTWPYAYGYLLTGDDHYFQVAYRTMLGQFEQSKRPSGYKWPMDSWKAFGKVGRHGPNYIAIAADLKRRGKLEPLIAAPSPEGTTILKIKPPAFQPPKGEGKLLLHASFDEALDAEGAGVVKATSHGALRLSPGVVGQALDTHGGYWSVPVPAGFGAEPGALAFWVAQRSDMTPDNPNQRGLFHAVGGPVTENCISLVLNYDRLIVRQYEEHGWLVSNGIVAAPWRKDEWHHVCLRWTAGKAELFLDGKQSWQTGEWYLLKESPKLMYLGWRIGNWLARSRFDELRVYSGWVPDAEIADLAARPSL